MKKNQFWTIVLIGTMIGMIVTGIINHVEFNHKVDKMLNEAVETINENRINKKRTIHIITDQKPTIKETKNIYRQIGGEQVGTYSVWSDEYITIDAWDNAPEWLKKEAANYSGKEGYEAFYEGLYNQNHTVYFNEIDEYNKDNLTLDEDQIIR